MVYLRDVARAAGVSTATVSRVLDGAGYPVKAETRERVLAAAARLEYQPNGLARSLRLGRSNTVGVCTTGLGNPPVISALEGIIEECRVVNRHTRVVITGGDPTEEERQLQLFLHERVAGVISYPTGAPPTAYLALQQAGIPIVLINRHVPGLAAPLVRYDFARGYADVVRLLADQGHRRIGAILPGDSATRLDHALAWRAAFDGLGMDCPEDLVRGMKQAEDSESLHQSIREILHTGRPATAIFAGMVLPTLATLRVLHDASLRVPEDVTLVGTGDRRWDLLITPRIPLLCLDSFRLGRQAADILNDLIDVPSAASASEVVVSVRIEHTDALPSGDAASSAA